MVRGRRPTLIFLTNLADAMSTTPTLDSSSAKLIRRFSTNPGSEFTWHFSTIDSASGQFYCNGAVVHDSILTFVDPDSNGQFQKFCRRYDASNRCLTPGDSVFKLVAPPGPHDGFLTWYSVTYEKKNTTDTDYEDLFVADTLDAFARCATPGVRNSCPNLNNKFASLAGPLEPTAGPTADLEGVLAVPNPYRGNEVWDPSNGSEVHFINMPKRATIRIFTVSGDLVRTIHHRFDAAHELTAVSDPDSSYTFTYDPRGRRTSVDNYGTPGVPNAAGSCS